MGTFKKKVTFLENAIVKDHNGKVTESYKAGEVLETNAASANYWVRTRKAVPGDVKVKQTEPEAAPDTMKRQAPITAPEKPEAKTETETAPVPKKKRAAKKKTAPKKQAD